MRESISLTGRENLVLVARLRHLKDPGAIADETASKHPSYGP
ncbi:hypothetical protein [Streptosporangium subroseum]|nr:hypothetical protein OHB15_19195 [Streptosporangium subroseum]